MFVSLTSFHHITVVHSLYLIFKTVNNVENVNPYYLQTLLYNEPLTATRALHLASDTNEKCTALQIPQFPFTSTVTQQPEHANDLNNSQQCHTRLPMKKVCTALKESQCLLQS